MMPQPVVVNRPVLAPRVLPVRVVTVQPMRRVAN
jgi:hypothetical protein